MKGLLAAVRFLTVLPLPGGWGTGEADLARSAPFFPVVGLLIGAAAGAAAAGLARTLPTPLAGAIMVTALAAVSGGLHLDGLADTADGFLGSRRRERVLEIMKDSRIGTMGAFAVVSVLLLKVTALGTVPRGAFWRTVLLMPLAGRCALVIAMGLLPYARPGGGLGSVFCRQRSPLEGLWAAALLGLAGWFVSRAAGLAAAIASIVVTLAFAGYTYLRVGGATGDTLGATCEIAEVVPAVTMAGWYFSA